MIKKGPIRYDETICPEDTEKAKLTVVPTLFPNENSPLAIDFGGTCPHCGHNTETREWIVVVSGMLKMNHQQLQGLATALQTQGVNRSQGDETFDLACSCDTHHPGCPPGKKGCGARYRTRVIWP
jgi:hypothetical protein